MNRVWAMPNSLTFDIKPIGELISSYIIPGMVVVDPFANNNRFGTITNDLDPSMNTTHHMEALEFLNQVPDGLADVILYDPPYSPRQVSECYKKFGLTVNMQTTQSSFWGNLKKRISEMSRKGTIVISFGWNSNGIGKTKGFDLVEILIVAHGGHHNDTIVTVERKTE